MFKDKLRFGSLCLIVVIAAVSCDRGKTAMPATAVTSSPTSTAIPVEDLPTLRPPNRGDPGITISDCLLEQQVLPYLCGVIPGQMTIEGVRERLGEPDISRGGVAFIIIPDKSRIDEVWGYDGLGIYFDDETVIALGAGLRAYELTLGEAVETLGPPERIILLQEEGALPGWEQARRADLAFFLWPSSGIHLFTTLYETQGVGLDEDEEVPPFPSELSINILTAFEPCTLEELESVFQGPYSPGPWTRWIDWPGMNE